MVSKRLIAFDLDGTLAPSKSPIPREIAKMLEDLISRYHVCIISGGDYPQFEKQVLSQIKSGFLHRLHLMPTCGTKYYKFYTPSQEWECVYADKFSAEEVEAIIEALDWLSEEFFTFDHEVWGPQIEDRGSQITFSALGQEAPVKEKEEWDPSGNFRREMKEFVEEQLPQLEVRVGGTTSLDITKKGVDKSYGMTRLLRMLNLSIDEAVFFGDRLEPGGNDYPVERMGIECIKVSSWEDTCAFVKENL